jgi:hypothetical protein
MNTLQVRAASGLAVPMEDKPRTYIGDAETMEVVDSGYYQRRIAEGDLIIQDNQSDATVQDVLAQDAAADTKKTRNTSKTTGE